MTTQPDIVVIETCAPIADSRYMATFGDYDLDCITGTGRTPLDAIVDLLDQEESASWHAKGRTRAGNSIG